MREAKEKGKEVTDERQGNRERGEKKDKGKV